MAEGKGVEGGVRYMGNGEVEGRGEGNVDGGGIDQPFSGFKLI